MKSAIYYLLVLTTIFLSACGSESDSSANNKLSYATEYEADTEMLDGSGLPIIDFDVQSAVITNSGQYTIDLDLWDIPNDGTDARKTTANLQSAIDWAHEEEYGSIELPAGTYLVGTEGNDIYQAGIDIYNETEFVFSAGAVLQMEANDKWNYCVLRLNGDNIIVRDGTIIGDRESHEFVARDSDGSTSHDEGHGICVWDNNQVLIDNMVLKGLTGDGSLVLDSSDITFTNNTIFNNRRQGISIVGGIRIAIEDNEIFNINGTSPQFAIDIEGAGRVDQDIIIQNNYFHHNVGGDIVNASGTNVYILDNIMEQGEGSKYVDGPIVSWHKTHNIIARNTITMVDGSVNGRLGYIQYSNGGDKGHNRATYVHENTCNSCGMYMYKSAHADVRRNQFLGYFMAFTDFDNAILVDNSVTYSAEHTNLRYCWSYRFNNATGYASGNLLEGELEEIPLSQSEPYTLQCVLDGW